MVVVDSDVCGAGTRLDIGLVFILLCYLLVQILSKEKKAIEVVQQKEVSSSPTNCIDHFSIFVWSVSIA